MDIRNEYILSAPKLECGDADIRLAFEAALKNVLDTNTVHCPFETYNSTGLLDPQTQYMLRAGGFYQTPWTRDASINSWGAANLLAPRVARNTLLAVCQRAEDGRLYISRDNQVWDKIVWAIGGWNYWLVNRDDEFFGYFREILLNTLEELIQTRFLPERGLFRGGSFFNDGISAYPAELDSSPSDFMGHHAGIEQVMCLSTNCIYFIAEQIAARVCDISGDAAGKERYTVLAAGLKNSINSSFFDPERDKYAYILFSDGRVCDAQEAFGNIFALLSGVCPQEKAKQLIMGLVRSKNGIVTVWPPFEGVSTEEKPGRHNNTIWPFVNGFLAYTAAKNGCLEISADEIACMTRLVKNSDWEFYEIYDSTDGKPRGGWQKGKPTDSRENQTWSASAYIRAIINGAFGLDADERGLTVSPIIPEYMRDGSLTGINAGGTLIDLYVKGWGSKIVSAAVNGEACNGKLRIPAASGKKFRIDVTLTR